MPSRNAKPLPPEAYKILIDMLLSDHEVLDRCPLGAQISIWGMAVCGLRIGESAEISRTWHNMTASGSELHIPDESYDPNSDSEGWSPKTHSGVRSVPIPQTMKCHATGERIQIPFGRLLQSYFVGLSEVNRGSQSIRNWLYKIVRHTTLTELLGEKTVDLASKKRIMTAQIIPHDLRATWATQALRSDVGRYTIRDWGGWENTEMIDRYAKYVGDPSGKEIQKF